MRNDARRSFRIQTPEHQQRGVFVLGRRRFPVLMLNASADGFAFLSPQPIQVPLGAVARLQHDDAWYEVLLVRCEETAEGSLVGVERLADVKDSAGIPVGGDWPGSASLDARSTASTLAGVLLCAGLSAYLIAGRPTLDALLRTLTEA